MSDQPKVLLVDGMSLLVRAARAARNMSRLSHDGTDTTTLVAFTGSLVRALKLEPWEYVVVAWEGHFGLNWRLKFYPAYKSSRPQRHDSSVLLSRDEELAREFTEAAGICQAWEPTMEGDDIIACAWRQFQASSLRPRITILSADRDLLQLVGPETAFLAGAGLEPVTEADVMETWGVAPARLPLLRALAGDPSDGIPGIMSIGPARAVRMITYPGKSDLAILHSLAVTLGLDRQALVYAWWVISELREPVLAPDLDLGKNCEHAEWHPGQCGESFRAFLDKYGMARLAARMDAGELPWPAVPDKESI